LSDVPRPRIWRGSARGLLLASLPFGASLVGAPSSAAPPLAPASSASQLGELEPADPAQPEEVLPAAPVPSAKRPPPPRLSAGPPVIPKPELSGHDLVRQDDGTYLHVDPYKRFTAVLERDGTVSFGDRWRRPTRTGDRQHGRCCAFPRGLFGPMGLSVTGPTEWVMALAGVDRDARAKAEFMASTRELRTALAIAWHLDNLQRRLDQIGDDLERIWRDQDRSPAERRALLFQRWDECDEPLAPTPDDLPEGALTILDEARLGAAQRARLAIESFIRERLPPGHKDSYTRAELTALNARRVSRAPFAPYRRTR
jgi:hypothetical protein